MYRLLCALSLAVAASPLLNGYAAAAELSVTQHEGGARIEIDGKLFTDYLIHTGPKPILWPIIGPTGVAMTRAFPMEKIEGEKQDHPHQRSLWFTHGDVNGIDFWSELKGHGSIVHREFVTAKGGKDQAVIVTRNDWLGPDGKKQCEDERRLTFGVGDKTRVIEFEIALKATAGPVVFGDTKEGTMGIRIPTVMDVNSKLGGRIITSEGLTDKDAWGKPAAWVDYHGPVQGRVVGVAIMNHPSSFRYPTRWHVRDYGLFAANPFGLKDFENNKELNGSYTIPDGESITLRYGFVFHEGDEKAAGIAKLFERYAAEKR